MSAANACRLRRMSLVRWHHHLRSYSLRETLEHFNPYAQAVGRMFYGMTAVCVVMIYAIVRVLLLIAL
jgi:hypothetical protein